MQAWDERLTPEQKEAASYSKGHAVVFAGPGTGKTTVLVHHALYLVQERGIRPSEILGVTFTRTAGSMLRKRLSDIFDRGEMPQVLTLHSFSLRELMANRGNLLADGARLFGGGFRIADDWELDNIVKPDLRDRINEFLPKEGARKDVTYIEDQLNLLEANWYSPQDSSRQASIPPDFIRTLRDHQSTYRYARVGELTYHLFDQVVVRENEDFRLSGKYKHILADEYQDLNYVEIQILRKLAEASPAIIFAAGDDDQSIYSFRHAFPEGIRAFEQDFEGAKQLTLTECQRFGPNILDIARHIAEQDLWTGRKPKGIQAAPHTIDNVDILHFPNSTSEGEGIATICRLLLKEGVCPGEILIVAKRWRCLEAIEQALVAGGIESVRIRNPDSPLDLRDGRYLLAIMHLSANPSDELACRTVVQNSYGFGRGSKGLQTLVMEAYSHMSFLKAIETCAADSRFPFSKHLAQTLEHTRVEVNEARESLAMLGPQVDKEQFIGWIQRFFSGRQNGSLVPQIVTHLQENLEPQGSMTLQEWLGQLATLNVAKDYEQFASETAVTLSTIHRAKGLDRPVVFVVAAEDEEITTKDDIGEVIRLFHVATTRACQRLYLTYCRNRAPEHGAYTLDGIAHFDRTLIRFLRQYTRVRDQNGPAYIGRLTTTRSG